MTVQLAGRLAERGDVALGSRCPIDRTLALVGNRTSILLVREIFYGATRFDALHKRVGVTEAVAAQRLKELVAGGVLTKEPYREPGQRTRHEYVLTPAGHELLPALMALLQWGVDHTDSDRPPTTATHAGCGEPVRSELCCAAGHAVDEADLVIGGAPVIAP